jgi:hypothetical protein
LTKETGKRGQIIILGQFDIFSQLKLPLANTISLRTGADGPWTP